MHKIKSGKGRTQSPVLKFPCIAFLFLTEVLKSGRLSLQTIFFAFASRYRYMQGYLFHKYYCTICVCIEPRFKPWVGKIPWQRERLPSPVFWPAEFPGLYSPCGGKESDMTKRLSLSTSSRTPSKRTRWPMHTPPAPLRDQTSTVLTYANSRQMA